MVVSDRFRFIFVHIPKCGGTSCAAALRAALPWHERRHWVTPRTKTKHLTLQQAHERMSARPPLHSFWQKSNVAPENYLAFAFVRNPWDRAVSIYHYLRVAKTVPKANAWSSFDDFVRAVESGADWLNALRSMRPQSDYLSDQSGRLAVDAVGRFEQIDEDFDRITSNIGLAAVLPHLNKSERKDYRTYYTPWSVDVIAQQFRTDVDNFGYAFDQPSEQAAA